MSSFVDSRFYSIDLYVYPHATTMLSDYCNLVVSFEIGKHEGVVALGENYLGMRRFWNKILPGVICGQLSLSVPKWKLIGGESSV